MNLAPADDLNGCQRVRGSEEALFADHLWMCTFLAGGGRQVLAEVRPRGFLGCTLGATPSDPPTILVPVVVAVDLFAVAELWSGFARPGRA